MSLLNEIWDSTSENTELVLNETLEVLNEVNKVQFDKKTLNKRMLRQCELLAAKRAGSPVYDKYVKATKIRKKCRELIHAQFEGKAKILLKEYLKARKAKQKESAKKEN